MLYIYQYPIFFLKLVELLVSGFILKEETVYPSNWRSEGSIGDYLIKNNITGIKNVDTRAIVSHIRDKGAMNGIISSLDHDIVSLKKKLSNAPKMLGLDLAKEVTCSKAYLYNPKKPGMYNVAVVDFGIKSGLPGSQECPNGFISKLCFRCTSGEPETTILDPKQAPGQCPLARLNLQCVAKSDIGLLET